MSGLRPLPYDAVALWAEGGQAVPSEDRAVRFP